MAERIITPLGETAEAPLTPEAMAEGLAKTEAFLKDVAPHLGRLFGVDLNIQIGEHWATSLEPGVDVVTADPRFFIEKGYTPEMSSYATMHEVAAHLKEKVTEPKLTDRVLNFIKPVDQENPRLPLAERPVDPTKSIFHNIFSDIAGNNLIHAVLPSMSSVAAQLYQEKLFAETDYRPQPRHIQFLYKIIREEMVPDSETAVLPEVDEAIAGLRDYQGEGDVIKYSTAVAKSARIAMPAEERFKIWTSIIYPVFEKLLEQDRQDPERQNSQNKKPGATSSGQPAGDTKGESQPGEGSPGQDGQPSDSQRFDTYYKDYRQNRHPDPLSHDDQDKLHQHAKEKARTADQLKSPRAIQTEQERRLDEQIKRETGHSLREQRQYDTEIFKWQSVISEMRDVFQQVINERVAQKRGLSRRSFSEGAVLNPDQLVQTVIDIRNNVRDPEAFRDYETARGETQAIGKTDYVFLLDASGSMAGENASAAASSTVIGLEGLSALQRDVEEAEAKNNIELDLDIRTAIYTFGDDATCLKPLSTKVTEKERLDAYAAVSSPDGSSTRDYLALEEIEGWENDTSRRRIIIAISDGRSNSNGVDTSPQARQAIDKLRGKGWFVYGVSIGSDDAERLYQPTARRVDDPAELPQTIYNFIEATIT